MTQWLHGEAVPVVLCVGTWRGIGVIACLWTTWVLDELWLCYGGSACPVVSRPLYSKPAGSSTYCGWWAESRYSTLLTTRDIYSIYHVRTHTHTCTCTHIHTHTASQQAAVSTVAGGQNQGIQRCWPLETYIVYTMYAHTHTHAHVHTYTHTQQASRQLYLLWLVGRIKVFNAADH